MTALIFWAKTSFPRRDGAREELTAPLPGKNDFHCSEKKPDIGPEGPVVDVIQIEANNLVEIVDGVAAADLPKAGDPRLDADAAAVPVLVLFDFRRRRWAGADQAHLAPEHIPELGQFVETRLAQEMPDRDDAGIVLDLENGPLHLILVHQLLLARLGVDIHGTEFPAFEDATVHADPVLAEKNRAGIVALDGKGDEGEGERRDRQADQGADDIEQALEKELLGVQALGRKGQNRHFIVKNTQLASGVVEIEKIEHQSHGDADLFEVAHVLVDVDHEIPGHAEDHLINLRSLADLDEIPDIAENRVPLEFVFEGPITIGLQKADDAQPPVFMVFDQFMKTMSLFLNADDQQIADVVAPGPEDPEKIPDQKTFRDKKNQGKEEEFAEHDPTEVVNLEEKDGRDTDRAAEHMRFDQPFNDLAIGEAPDRGIKPVFFEEKEPQGNDDQQQPGVVLELPHRHPVQMADGKSQEKRNEENDDINNSV